MVEGSPTDFVGIALLGRDHHAEGLFPTQVQGCQGRATVTRQQSVDSHLFHALSWKRIFFHRVLRNSSNAWAREPTARSQGGCLQRPHGQHVGRICPWNSETTDFCLAVSEEVDRRQDPTNPLPQNDVAFLVGHQFEPDGRVPAVLYIFSRKSWKMRREELGSLRQVCPDFKVPCWIQNQKLHVCYTLDRRIPRGVLEKTLLSKNLAGSQLCHFLSELRNIREEAVTF
mmetsp:Transcript_64126/g.134826  ORF Transcript_64126/g.134826 Transcript_64126/m.134826 type:complete len:228 (+) Transcript_64126:241-924(+)